MAFRMRFGVRAVLIAFGLTLGTAQASATPVSVRADEPAKLCFVETATETWAGGYIASVIVKNISDRWVTWTGTLTPLNGLGENDHWGAVFTRNLVNNFTITPPAYAPSLGPSQSVQFGYTGSDPGAPLPTIICKPLLP
jgi:cellulose 1,4-beta-cellobiosidase